MDPGRVSKRDIYQRSTRRLMVSHKIGIVCALAQEARLFTESARDRQAAIKVSAQILLTESGVGLEKATHAAQQLIEQGATCLVSWGFAGSLTDSLKPGQLLVPRFIRGVNECFEVETTCLTSLLPHGYPSGTLYSTNEIIRTAQHKSHLHKQYRVDAVDMESLAVMKVARQHRISALAIRAIVDGPLDVIPDFITAEIDIIRIIKTCLTNPASIISLLHLAAGYRKATGTLAPIARKMIAMQADEK